MKTRLIGRVGIDDDRERLIQCFRSQRTKRELTSRFGRDTVFIERKQTSVHEKTGRFRSEQPIGLRLDQSQKAMAVASATAERKLAASLS